MPKIWSRTKIEEGTEVGNIFQLGPKYSESMGANFLNVDGKSMPFFMGSYGIGISRCVATIVDQYHDQRGIVWPLQIAPFQIIVTVVNPKKEEQIVDGTEIYSRLKKAGYEVMLDDRKVSPGIKFADRDLLGIPLRITVGRDISEKKVEVSLRKDNIMDTIRICDIDSYVAGILAGESLELS